MTILIRQNLLQELIRAIRQAAQNLIDIVPAYITGSTVIDLAGFMKLFDKFDTDLMLWVTIPNRVTEDWYPSKDQISRVWSNKVLLTGKYSLCSLLVGRAIVHHYEFGR